MSVLSYTPPVHRAPRNLGQNKLTGSIESIGKLTEMKKMCVGQRGCGVHILRVNVQTAFCVDCVNLAFDLVQLGSVGGVGLHTPA